MKVLWRNVLHCILSLFQSILRNAAIPGYLKPLPFQKVTLLRGTQVARNLTMWRKIRFLGGKLGKAIAEEYEASTVGDLL